MHHNFYLICLLSFLSCIVSYNPQGFDNKNTIINSNDIQYNVECETQQKCTECSFDQLKSQTECGKTGLIQILLCTNYDYKNQKKFEPTIKIQSCVQQVFKVSSFHKLIMFFILLFVFSVFIRRREKKRILGNALNKYKSIKNN